MVDSGYNMGMELGGEQLKLLGPLVNMKAKPTCPNGCLEYCMAAVYGAEELMVKGTFKVLKQYAYCMNRGTIDRVVEAVMGMMGEIARKH